MPLSLISRLLIFAVALRFGANLLYLIFGFWTFGVAAKDPVLGHGLGLSLFAYGPWEHWFVTRMAIWALHEFPQTLANVLEVIFVEGLYRVWRNLRRVRAVIEAGVAT